MASDQTIVSIDFKPVPEQEARISVFDRGFLFGDSVYEVVRTYGFKLFAFDRHYQRLKRSAKALGFDLPFEGDDLEAHFEEMISSLGNESCYLRVIVTRGVHDVILYPPDDPKPSTVVIAGALPAWPADYYEKGIALVTVGIRRNAKGALNPMIKSGNYLNNVLAAQEARHTGAVDAIMLNAEGFVTESSTANIFLVKNGTLITPPMEAGILDGVSRHVVIELAATIDFPCEQKLFGPEVLHSAEECFLTSTTREVMPVSRVDLATIPSPGPVTLRLLEMYREHVNKGD